MADWTSSPGEERLDELTQLMPHADLVVIEDAAHCPSLDQPEVLGAIVTDFVAGIVR